MVELIGRIICHLAKGIKSKVPVKLEEIMPGSSLTEILLSGDDVVFRGRWQSC